MILIVKDEAHCIKRCLDSVAWVDEIIVLDSGSTDETVKLCKTYTTKVFETDWPGFGVQKNRALEKATGDWVLSIDADEWLSDGLIKEIKQVISHPAAEIYTVPRRTQYLGKWLRYGDGGKDSVVRLFKRGSAKFTNDSVHERLMADAKNVSQLKEVLFHNSYESVEELIEKMNQYSTLSAKMRYEKGKKSSLAKAITHAMWAFFRSYILRAGFLDGRIGFIVAVSIAGNSYYRYLKLLYFK